MKIMRVENLKPGFVVGMPLLDSAGAVMLQRGVALTEGYIATLKHHGYRYIYIQDKDDLSEYLPDQNLSPSVRASGLQTLHKGFDDIKTEIDRIRSKTRADIREVLTSDTVGRLLGARGPMRGMAQIVESILQEIMTRQLLAGIATIQSSDAEMYNHAIDVCVVSIMIGRAVGMSTSDLKGLAAGALLHDIGKLFSEPSADPAVFNRRHTEFGYEFLKQSDEHPISVRFAAYEHHERPDGEGQPRRIKTSNTVERNRNTLPPIPTLAGEIVAAANRYDNLLNGKKGSRSLPPDQVIATLRAEAGTGLNREIVQIFVKYVPVYPAGSEIIVIGGPYAGHTGVVTQVNHGDLDRPVIALTHNEGGQKIDTVLLNLLEHAAIKIRSQEM